MTINGIEIDKSKLLSMQEILDHLKLNDRTDSELTEILYRHDEQFGNSLMWRYPISDGVNAGVAIVTIQEGFLCLPYNCVDEVDYEIYDLDRVTLMDEDSLRYFIDEWKSFSDDLMGALGDMLRIIQSK